MSEASRLFDDMAPGYDEAYHLNVPDPHGFYSAVVEGLPFETDEELRVLDLGAGTGLLSAVVADRLPGARITLLDFSEKMLDVARERFAESSNRFEFRVLDYVRDPLPDEQGSYDLVVSALSFHHLTYADKRETISRINDALADDGWFVNADKVMEESSEVGKNGRDHHTAETRYLHEGSTSYYGHGIEPVALQTQMSWLREARFQEVECRYEKDGFAVYGGHKGQRKGA